MGLHRKFQSLAVDVQRGDALTKAPKLSMCKISQDGGFRSFQSIEEWKVKFWQSTHNDHTILQEFSKQRYTGRHQGKGFKTTVTSGDFEKLETKAGSPPPVMVNHVRRVEPKRRFTCIGATVQRLVSSYAFFLPPDRLSYQVISDGCFLDSLTLVFCLLLGAMIWYVSSSHVAPPLLWMPLTSATVEQWGEVHAPASDFCFHGLSSASYLTAI